MGRVVRGVVGRAGWTRKRVVSCMGMWVSGWVDVWAGVLVGGWGRICG